MVFVITQHFMLQQIKKNVYDRKPSFPRTSTLCLGNATPSFNQLTLNFDLLGYCV